MSYTTNLSWPWPAGTAGTAGKVMPGYRIHLDCFNGIDTGTSILLSSSNRLETTGKYINKHNQLKDDSTTWHKLILSIKKQTKDVGPICLRFPRSMVREI